MLPCEYLTYCSSDERFLQDPEDMDLAPLSFVCILKQGKKQVLPSEPTEEHSGTCGYAPPMQCMHALDCASSWRSWGISLTWHEPRLKLLHATSWNARRKLQSDTTPTSTTLSSLKFDFISVLPQVHPGCCYVSAQPIYSPSKSAGPGPGRGLAESGSTGLWPRKPNQTWWLPGTSSLSSDYSCCKPSVLLSIFRLHQGLSWKTYHKGRLKSSCCTVHPSSSNVQCHVSNTDVIETSCCKQTLSLSIMEPYLGSLYCTTDKCNQSKKQVILCIAK